MAVRMVVAAAALHIHAKAVNKKKKRKKEKEKKRKKKEEKREKERLDSFSQLSVIILPTFGSVCTKELEPKVGPGLSGIFVRKGHLITFSSKSDLQS